MIIDISQNNGTIDWRKVKEIANLEAVVVKVSEGVMCPDRSAKIDAVGVKSIGKPLHYYHFATLNNTDVFSDAKSEAVELVGLLKNLPSPEGYVWLDMEEEKIPLSSIQVQLWANTFFDTMKSSGYTKLGLYGGTPFLNKMLPNNHNLGIYPLWSPDYEKVDHIPKGWNQFFWHQYTDQGSVPGITGHVDLSDSNSLYKNT